MPNGDECECGHLRMHHIYYEGACRPGFVCGASCSVFQKPTREPLLWEGDQS